MLGLIPRPNLLLQRDPRPQEPRQRVRARGRARDGPDRAGDGERHQRRPRHPLQRTAALGGKDLFGAGGAGEVGGTQTDAASSLCLER